MISSFVKYISLFLAPDEVVKYVGEQVNTLLTNLPYLTYSDLMDLPVSTINSLALAKSKAMAKDPMGGLGGTLTNLLGGRM